MSNNSPEPQYLLMGYRDKNNDLALKPGDPNYLQTWKSSDDGFNEALLRHLEHVLKKSVTQKYFEKVLDAVKYCEESHDNFDASFDFVKYAKAQKLCEKLMIWGNFVGEGGDDD